MIFKVHPNPEHREQPKILMVATSPHLQMEVSLLLLKISRIMTCSECIISDREEEEEEERISVI